MAKKNALEEKKNKILTKTFKYIRELIIAFNCKKDV